MMMMMMTKVLMTAGRMQLVGIRSIRSMIQIAQHSRRDLLAKATGANGLMHLKVRTMTMDRVPFMVSFARTMRKSTWRTKTKIRPHCWFRRTTINLTQRKKAKAVAGGGHTGGAEGVVMPGVAGLLQHRYRPMVALLDLIPTDPVTAQGMDNVAEPRGEATAIKIVPKGGVNLLVELGFQRITLQTLTRAKCQHQVRWPIVAKIAGVIAGARVACALIVALAMHAVAGIGEQTLLSARQPQVLPKIIMSA
jgi:hypothetical protein